MSIIDIKQAGPRSVCFCRQYIKVILHRAKATPRLLCVFVVVQCEHVYMVMSEIRIGVHREGCLLGQDLYVQIK